MAFELFDLQSSTTFGLEAFSAEFNAFLTSGFNLYHQAYYLEKKFEGKRINGYRTQLEHSRSISALKKLTSLRRNDGHAAHSFIHRENMGKENPSFNQGFAHYSHDALLRAYDYLRVLESKLMVAEKQVSHASTRLFRRVPQETARNYSSYVSRQLKIIDDEYSKLTRAMLERLTLASEDPSLQRGDVLHRRWPKALIEDVLTPSNLQDFYTVIQLRGEVETKHQLSRLPWFEIVHKMAKHAELCKFSSVHNLAKIEMSSRHFHEQDVQGERSEDALDKMLEAVEKTERLIQEEQNNFTQRETFFNKWWRRLFNKENIVQIHNIQHCLQLEAGYVQRHKAVIQQRRIVLQTPPEPQTEEVQEIHIQPSYVESHIKSLEDLLLNSLVSRFKFSQESLEYMMNLKAQMIAREVMDVKALPGLSPVDKTFLGLNQKSFFSIFSGENRQIVSLTLNMIVLLEVQKNKINAIDDASQQAAWIHGLGTHIHRYLKKYGTAEVKKTIQAEASHGRSNGKS